MDSTVLRLWILLVGALLIAGIYGWDKWQERRSRRGTPIDDDEEEIPRSGKSEKRLEAIPILTDRHDVPGRDATQVREPASPAFEQRGASATQVSPPVPSKEILLAMSILAARGREFTGGELAQALRKAGMIYGAMKIFHAPADFERPDGPALYSLANMLEPGTLEPERLRLLATPGVVLFAQLPGPVNGVETFNLMHATGRFLAKELRGELCDERRQPFTEEKAEEVRARILSEIGDTVRKPDFD